MSDHLLNRLRTSPISLRDIDFRRRSAVIRRALSQLYKRFDECQPQVPEAVEASKAFEWTRRLGNKRTSFSALQPFKLRYAELLADVGHEVLAREYLLSISALVRGKESNEEEVLTPRPESEVNPVLELDTTAPPATQSRKEEVVPPAVTRPREEPQHNTAK